MSALNDPDLIDGIILNALREDIGSGDVTTAALIPGHHRSHAAIIAKSGFILSGLVFAGRVFGLVDAAVRFRPLKKEGNRVKAGDIIAKVSGNTGSILKAERTALNILQRASGVATLTNMYVQKVKGSGARIVDTRKTMPGLRYIDKYAVRTGGGHNHRYGLFDGVLIKDNHIEAAGGVKKAVLRARSKVQHIMKIEVEVRNISEAREAVTAGADVIMLDNMPAAMMRNSVKFIRRKAPGTVIEASGNVSLDNVRQIAETGVDIISVGALTHSAPAADISLKIVK